MRYVFLLSAFLLFKLSLLPPLHAFHLKDIEVYQSPEGSPIISIAFGNFPSQEILLSLKRQRNEVLILYEFELFKERGFGAELLQKEVYYQRAGYLPEENLYFVEDNFERKIANQAEDLLPKLSQLRSYPLSFPMTKEPTGETYLLVKVTLKFSTHLDKNLRYTPKERRVTYRASKKYVLP